jgi:thiol-disulfide isomerase/thioredoxin
MKYFILVAVVIINFTFSFSQEIIIKAANSSGKVAFLSLSGEKISFVDSIAALKSKYQLNLINSHPGSYRIVFDNNKWIDFVYDNEDVEIQTDANNILDSLRVIKSGSNKIYYDFVNLNKDYKIKTELLQLILARYPKEDDYYQITKETLNQIQEDYLYFVNVTAQANPKSFIARYVRSAQLPVIDIEIPPDRQLVFLKSHALDNVNFYDDGLIYSDAFTNKSIGYLTYYRNPQLPMGLLEKEFESAIDTILVKAKVNEIVYKHIVEYLLDGFKKFGFDNVINYIVENYVIKDEICLDEKLETALERRIQQSKNFKIGNTVPNIIIPDSTGSLIDLDKINSEKNTLIIFYASWCPHCQTLLPQVYELYKNQKEKKFEVVAVSIDTSKTDWLSFVKNNNLNWLNVSDLKGWEGQAVQDYSIYATPTMFLIDKNRKMIEMPKNIAEIYK